MPVRAAANWYVRSPSRSRLEDLKLRLAACLRAGAEAAGCGIQIEWIEPSYA